MHPNKNIIRTNKLFRVDATYFPARSPTTALTHTTFKRFLSTSPLDDRPASPIRQHTHADWHRQKFYPTLTSNQSQAISGMYSFLFPTYISRPKAQPSDEQVKQLEDSFFDGFAKRVEAHHAELQKPPTATMKNMLMKKRGEMDSCADDQQLLEWTAQLFSRQEEIESLRRSPSFSQREDREAITAELDAYPHIVSSLMSTFRDRYRDPHLALAVFDHVRHRSVASYVCGCKTPAYHQLLVTLWTCFKDIRSVANALREMKVNGVEVDGRIRELAGRITESPLGKTMTEAAAGDLQEIEQLIRPSRRSKTWSQVAKDWPPSSDTTARLDDTNDPWSSASSAFR